MSDDAIRSACKEKLESLEHWLRRLIDDTLAPVFGDYFVYRDSKGNNLIRADIAKSVDARRLREPSRYSRKIDAVLLDDAVAIVCKPELFNAHFRPALEAAFPNGREAARTYLNRIVAPRNHLAHSNAISNRDAERIICYSNDVIDSLKQYYRNRGMQQDYDVPLILRVSDSFGQTFTRAQCNHLVDGRILLELNNKPHLYLRPGDTYSADVEVDPAYDPSSYSLNWASTRGLTCADTGRKLALTIENRFVGQQFDLQCHVRTKRDWHRMSTGMDDFLLIYLKVLPPV
jgi:hypothetical protein